mgnify:CR=1 FL=1
MNKRTLAATKYQIWESRTAVITFYIVLLLIFLANIILNQIATADDGGAHNNYDGISFIFLFVAGICTFGQNLRLYLQCGLSRKQLTVSLLLGLLALSLIMTVCDFVFHLIITAAAPLVQGNILPMMGEMLYPDTNLLVRLFIHFCALTLFSYLGLLIAAIFFQIPKKFRWIYCVGLPVGAIALSIRLALSLEGTGITQIFLTFFGTPLRAIGMFGLITAILLGISHLLTMRSYLR